MSFQLQHCEARRQRSSFLNTRLSTLGCYSGLVISLLPMTFSSIHMIALAREIAFLFSLVLIFLRPGCRDRKYLPVYAFLVWIFISTALNRADINTTFSNFYPVISGVIFLCALFEERGSKALAATSMILSVMMLAQFFTTFVQLFPPANHGEVTYFFGTRVRISDVLIPMLGLTVLSLGTNQCKGVSRKIIYFLGILSALYFMVYEQVMTAFSAIIILVTTIMMARVASNRLFQQTMGTLLLALCALFVLSEPVRDSFAWFLEGALGKDVTLNGRTLLWQQGISNLFGWHWLVGNGYANGFVFSLPNGFEAMSAHSEYINMLFRFGAVGMIFLAYTYCVQVRLVRLIGNSLVRACVLGCALAIAFTGVSSTLYVNVYVYLWVCACLAYPSITSED